MIYLTIAALNSLKVLSCDIQNEYLTEKFWENIWNVEGPEFGYDQGKFMLIVMSQYGMKSYGAALGI